MTTPDAKWWEGVRSGAWAPVAAAEAVFRLEGKLHELGPNWIQCRVCGLVSRNPKDIEARYCGRCHLFLADLEGELRLR